MNSVWEDQIETEGKPPSKTQDTYVSHMLFTTIMVGGNQGKWSPVKTLGFCCINVGLIYLIFLPKKQEQTYKDYISIFIPL